MRAGKGGARVAAAGPEAEGPSDMPPMPRGDGLLAVAFRERHCIKERSERKVIQLLYDTTACCVVGGRAWNSLRKNPALAKIAWSSPYV